MKLHKYIIAAFTLTLLIPFPAYAYTEDGNSQDYRFQVTFIKESEPVVINDQAMYEALKGCGDNCSGLKDAEFDDKTQTIKVPIINAVKKINLQGKNLKDISDLTKFPALEEINLSHNQIEDISPLTELKKLQSFPILADNQIKDTSISLDICANVPAENIPMQDAGWSASCDSGEMAEFLIEMFAGNQNLNDQYPENTYPVPQTLIYARENLEKIYDLDGLDEQTRESINPDNWLYLENAELSEDGKIITIPDTSKPSTIAYRVEWNKYAEILGETWEEIPEEDRENIIEETGGNKDFWNIATLTLAKQNEPKNIIDSIADALNPGTGDSIKFYFILAGALITFSAVYNIEKRKRAKRD